MNYNLQHFINKFEAIPEENWCTGYLHKLNKSCALGHCGVHEGDVKSDGNYENKEAQALGQLFKQLSSLSHYDNTFDIVYHVNDQHGTVFYNLPTPKQRILAALYDIKSLQAVKQAEDIINSPAQLTV